MGQFTQALEVNIVFVSLDHVADCMIEKSYLGLAADFRGAVKSQVGEE
jgi:hypothetical protein